MARVRSCHIAATLLSVPLELDRHAIASSSDYRTQRCKIGADKLRIRGFVTSGDWDATNMDPPNVRKTSNNTGSLAARSSMGICDPGIVNFNIRLFQPSEVSRRDEEFFLDEVCLCICCCFISIWPYLCFCKDLVSRESHKKLDENLHSKDIYWVRRRAQACRWAVAILAV